MMLLLVTLGAVSCKESTTETVSQAGVYKNVSYRYVSATIDTTITDLQQVKIYTPTHFIYANLAADSSVGFGFGSYMQQHAKITENSIYNGTSLDTAADFTLEIQREQNGYTQVIPDIRVGGVSYKLTEKYVTIPSTGPSPLDGAWEQTHAITITGNDTTTVQQKHFKVYQGGHFMFVHRYPVDSAGTKFSNGFGFGTFTMDGESVIETNSLSNYSFILQKPITVTVKLNGTDAFVQTIADTANKSISMEYFKRVK